MKKVIFNGVSIINGDTHVSQYVKDHGGLDCYPGFFERLAPYIKPGDTVIDAGANLGDHTHGFLKMVGDDGTVIAIEPNPLPFECLCDNVSGAICIRAALSDRTAIMGIIQETNVGASWGTWNLEGRLTAPTLRLDDMNLPHLDFIKMDIEGFEVQALRGARRIIARHKPVMFIEVNICTSGRQGTSRKELFDLVRELGYRFEPWPADVNLETKDLFDILCIPL